LVPEPADETEEAHEGRSHSTRTDAVHFTFSTFTRHRFREQRQRRTRRRAVQERIAAHSALIRTSTRQPVQFQHPGTPIKFEKGKIVAHASTSVVDKGQKTKLATRNLRSSNNIRATTSSTSRSLLTTTAPFQPMRICDTIFLHFVKHPSLSGK